MKLPLFIITALSALSVASCGGGSSSNSTTQTPEIKTEFKLLESIGGGGSELFLLSSDGSVTFVKDIYAGESSSRPNNFVEFNGLTYFTAEDAANGQELWRSDGTPDGTILVKDLRVGALNGASSIVAFSGNLFIGGSDGTRGSSLYISDGTAEGIEHFYHSRVESTDNSGAGDYVLFNDLMLFKALSDDPFRSRYYVSDGTQEGTSEFVDINPYGSVPSLEESVELNGELLFYSTNGPTANGGVAYALFKTNGETIELVADINETDHQVSEANIRQLTKVGDKVVFTANDFTDDDANNVFSNNELWVSDGTSEGTQLLADLYPGSSDIGNIVSANNKIYFLATNEGNYDAYDLWRSDITTEGTTKLQSGISRRSQLVQDPSSKALFLYQYSSADMTTTFSTLSSSDDSVTEILTFPAETRNPFFLGDGFFFYSDKDGDSFQELYFYDVDKGLVEDVNIDGIQVGYSQRRT